MKSLISAIRTLTIIPIPGKDTENFASAVPFFPIPAFILGSIPLGVYYLFKTLGSSEWFIASLISLFITSALTGFLHIDGLGDVADAFGGGKTKERILEILKDSRMGTFGICAILFDLLFKLFLWEWAFRIGSPQFILLSFILARAAQMIYLIFMKSARSDGIAASFIKTTKVFIFLTLLSIIASVFAFYFFLSPLELMIAIIAFILILFFGIILFNKKIDGITGDCLGTINELEEIGILFFLFIYSILN